MRAREMLSKIRWHPEYKGKEYKITYLHRGARNDERTILFTDIEDFFHSDFLLTHEDGSESYIPFHRVLRIEDIDGKPIWKKRTVRD